MTAAGTGWDREQRTSPVQNSSVHCTAQTTYNNYKRGFNDDTALPAHKKLPEVSS